MCLVKKAIFSGVVLLFFAVLIGAFGSHALDAILESNNKVDVFAIASQYHFYNAFALVFYGLLLSVFEGITFQRITFLCFFFGAIFFSGSLYLLAIFNITWLGAVTPIGGSLILLGWLLLAYSVWVGSPKSENIIKNMEV